MSDEKLKPYEKLDRLRTGDTVMLDHGGESIMVEVARKSYVHGPSNLSLPGCFTLYARPADPTGGIEWQFKRKNPKRRSNVKHKAWAHFYRIHVSHRRADYFSEETHWGTTLQADYYDHWGERRSVSHSRVRDVSGEIDFSKRDPSEHMIEGVTAN